jgi:AAA domain/Bifunctional DNA primase/polymerase, N-terminal/Primase C terminal 2 (PriCT-2)
MSNKTNGQSDDDTAYNINTPSMLEAALFYAKKNGTHVFPAPPGEKKSYKSKKYSQGRNWGATRDPEEIKRDFKHWPKANLALPTGSENGFFVVEADTLEGHQVDGIASLKALEAKHGKLPPTRIAESPSGSEHYYFKYPTDCTIKNSASEIADGVDVRGEGGMVIAPPSIKPGVGVYKWLNQLPIAEAPQWLIDLCKVDENPHISGNDQGEVDIDELVAALTVIANDNLGWEKWNRIGMAIYRATDGSHAGFHAFDQWSKKSKEKYNSANTHDSWYKKYRSCPPDKIGVGTIFYLAGLEAPGWRVEYQEKALQAIYETMRATPPGSDQPETKNTGTAQAQNQSDNEPPKQQQQPDDEPPPKSQTPPKSGISATPFAWIDWTKIPMREWLYEPHYIRQFVSLLISTGGIGKSSLLIAEALAMVSGRDLLDVIVDELLRVWYWNGEDPTDELQRRFAAAIKHFELKPDDINDRLFLDSGRNMPIVLAEEGKHGTVIAVPVVKDVIETLMANKIDVLMIDPFVSCHHVSENDNTAIERVAKTWSEIAEVANCSIMLSHHTRKTMGGNNVSVDDGRGASALLAAARTARTLNNMTKEEADNAQIDLRLRTFHFRSDIGKANLTRPAESADWFKLVPVDLENNAAMPNMPGDEVGVVTAWEYPTVDEFKITVADIQRAQEAIKANGPFRRDQRTKEKWIGNPIAEALGRDIKQNKKWVAQCIERWLANGLLKIDERRDPSVKHRDPVAFVIAGRVPELGDEEGF